MKTRLRYLSTAMALAQAMAALAAAPGEGDPLFLSDAALAVTITAPVDTLLRDRPDEEELAGTFSWRDAEGRERSVHVAIRTRGNYRRDRSTCPFPPLRLNFRKSEVAGTLFDAQDKVKLVTHCRTNSRRYEAGLLREYMAYRMFNTLSDLSFRVRLLEIRYVDSHRDGKIETEFGFLIESDDRLAARTGLEVLRTPSTRVSSLDPGYTNLVSMFQYMIANTDFSPIAGATGEDCCHNVELFVDAEGVQWPVPYDFDMSGLVDARYAVPNPKLRIRNVRQRLYRGRCENTAHVAGTVTLFVGQKAEIYGVIDETPALEDRRRREVRRFIDDFYETIEDPKDLDRNVVRACL